MAVRVHPGQYLLPVDRFYVTQVVVVVKADAARQYVCERKISSITETFPEFFGRQFYTQFDQEKRCLHFNSCLQSM